MRRLLITCLLALSAAAVLVPAPLASAATGPAPVITKVQPMRVSVGSRLVIGGRHFNPRRLKNTVIFRAPSGRSAFAKPRRATSRKLVLTVPAPVSRLLTVSGNRQRPTRMKLRVLAGKFSRFTSRRLSPVVTGVGTGNGAPGGGNGGSGGGLAACNSSADHDGDLLANTFELQIGTDPCVADTDRDQMSDGWEFWSARDLNVKAVPYPGRRPFPNALDPSDGGAAGATASQWDFDGDGLTTLEEYRTWVYTGASFDTGKLNQGPTPPDLESVLGYSDGTKFSRNVAPGAPDWRGDNYQPHYGLPVPTQPFPLTYNFHGDAAWRDDERDADGDGLSNWLEAARGPGKSVWWAGFFAQDATKAEAWPKPATACGQEFGAFTYRPFAELDPADPDVDGDTLLDGEDDQDFDDYNNISELYEVVSDLDGDGPFNCAGLLYPSMSIDVGAGVERRGINPFNPCAPHPHSRTCDDYKPFG